MSEDITKVLNERENSHGDYTIQAGSSQAMKEILKELQNWQELFPSMKESLELIVMKISRIGNGNSCEPDHWKDIAGYAMLIVRELEKDV